MNRQLKYLFTTGIIAQKRADTPRNICILLPFLKNGSKLIKPKSKRCEIEI